MDQYNLMAQQEEMAYARYQDDLNRYYADLDRAQAAYDNERDYDYSRFADDRDFDYGKYMDDLNYQYQVGRDQVTDDQWMQVFLHQQEQDRIAQDQWQKEYDEMVRQYNENLAWQKEQAAAKASGGGGGRSSGGGTPTTQQTGSSQNFMEYMNSLNKAAGNGGLTTKEATAVITQAAKEGLIKKEDQLNYLTIYG
jgi:hypothetical protein